MKSGRCSSIARSVASASKRGSSTMWLPWNSPAEANVNGALWYSGPGIRTQPPRRIPLRGSAGTIPGSPERISFGRPVDPPDVGAFQVPAAAGGSGSSLRPGSGARPAGHLTRPGTRSAWTPTTRAESATSTIVASSRPGRRAETGCGTAPSFQQATAASTNSTELGMAIVTRSSRPTPSAANARARRLLRRLSSPRVTEEPATVTAGRSGSSTARRPSACPIGSPVSFMLTHFVDDPGARHQREARGHNVVAAPGLADRERAALGRGDEVAADEVAVLQQPALHVRAPRHARAHDGFQAGEVVRPAGLRRPVQRVGQRKGEHVTHDRDRVRALPGYGARELVGVVGPSRQVDDPAAGEQRA